MKHRTAFSLSFCAALLSTTALAACGDDDDTSGPGGSGGGNTTATTGTTSSSTTSSSTSGSTTSTGVASGTLEASWTIAVQGVSRDCFWGGASYVDLLLEDAEGATTTARFECDTAEGSHELPSGSYTVTPSLVAFDDTPTFEGDPVEVVIEPGNAADLPIAFDIPGARIAGTWTILQDGVAATCDDVGAHRAEILASSLSGAAFANTFDCPLGTGTTDFFPLGTYEVTVSLLYEQDVVLVTSDIIDTTLETPGSTVDLPNVEFDIVTP